VIVKKLNPSKSSGATYTTQFDTETGASSCNCRGWTYKRGDAPRSCSHTRELEAAQRAPRAAKVLAFAPVAETAASRAARADVKKNGLPERDFHSPAPVAGPPAVKPMLASAMPEDKTVEDFVGPGWAMEEKFDGHRLTLVVGADGTVTGWSRPGAARPAALRPLPRQIVADAQRLPVGTYDGELHIPGGTSSDVVRLDRQGDLRLALFDAVEILGTNLMGRPLSTRREALALAVAHCEAGAIVLAEQWPVNLAAVKAIWARGGEGAILKRLDSTYRSGWRTPDWVKVKAIGAAELTVTGYEKGERGPHSVLALRHDDGRTTTVKVQTNDTLAAIDAAPEAFLGRRVTISYMGTTTGGQWRHPIFDHFADEG